MTVQEPIRCYPMPANEWSCMQVVEALNRDARSQDPFVGHVTALAKQIMGVPIAVLSLISGEQQRFLAATPRAFAVGARPTERVTDGIGLGLPLTNCIVELHDGELDLIPGIGGMSARIRLPTYRNV